MSPAGTPHRWRIGWFGYLDDERSWHSLKALAEAMPDKVEVYIRGLPYTNFNMASFLSDIALLPNVTYGGGFSNPDDLARIYGAVHLIWSIDCNDLAANSKWLLTNSLYEAGYLKKPVLALSNTAVGQFVAAWGCGWCLEEPIEQNLARFVTELSPDEYNSKISNMTTLTSELFSETNEIEQIWALLQRNLSSSSVVKITDPRLPVL